jgi:hypothetical protein
MGLTSFWDTIYQFDEKKSDWILREEKVAVPRRQSGAKLMEAGVLDCRNL